MPDKEWDERLELERLDAIAPEGMGPSTEEMAEAGADLIPAYRFMFEPLPRLRPISRVLTKLMQIQRGLFLYYARPVFQKGNEEIDPWRRYLGSVCGGAAVSIDFATEPPAEEVLPLVDCLDRRMQRIDDFSRRHRVVGYDGPEPPPEDPAEEQKPLVLGWQIHPLAAGSLEACGSQIRELTDVLLKSDPDQPIAAILDHTRWLSTVRAM